MKAFTASWTEETKRAAVTCSAGDDPDEGEQPGRGRANSPTGPKGSRCSSEKSSIVKRLRYFIVRRDSKATEVVFFHQL